MNVFPALIQKQAQLKLKKRKYALEQNTNNIALFRVGY